MPSEFRHPRSANVQILRLKLRPCKTERLYHIQIHSAVILLVSDNETMASSLYLLHIHSVVIPLLF